MPFKHIFRRFDIPFVATGSRMKPRGKRADFNRKTMKLWLLELSSGYNLLQFTFLRCWRSILSKLREIADGISCVPQIICNNQNNKKVWIFILNFDLIFSRFLKWSGLHWYQNFTRSNFYLCLSLSYDLGFKIVGTWSRTLKLHVTRDMCKYTQAFLSMEVEVLSKIRSSGHKFYGIL